MSDLNKFLTALNSNDPSVMDDRKKSNRKRIINGLKNRPLLRATGRILLDRQKQLEKDSQRLKQHFEARTQSLTDREQSLTDREQSLADSEQSLADSEQELAAKSIFLKRVDNIKTITSGIFN